MDRDAYNNPSSSPYSQDSPAGSRESDETHPERENRAHNVATLLRYSSSPSIRPRDRRNGAAVGAADAAVHKSTTNRANPVTHDGAPSAAQATGSRQRTSSSPQSPVPASDGVPPRDHRTSPEPTPNTASTPPPRRPFGRRYRYISMVKRMFTRRSSNSSNRGASPHRGLGGEDHEHTLLDQHGNLSPEVSNMATLIGSPGSPDVIPRRLSGFFAETTSATLLMSPEGSPVADVSAHVCTSDSSDSSADAPSSCGRSPNDGVGNVGLFIPTTDTECLEICGICEQQVDVSFMSMEQHQVHCGERSRYDKQILDLDTRLGEEERLIRPPMSSNDDGDVVDVNDALQMIMQQVKNACREARNTDAQNAPECRHHLGNISKRLEKLELQLAPIKTKLFLANDLEVQVGLRSGCVDDTHTRGDAAVTSAIDVQSKLLSEPIRCADAQASPPKSAWRLRLFGSKRKKHSQHHRQQHPHLHVGGERLRRSSTTCSSHPSSSELSSTVSSSSVLTYASHSQHSSTESSSTSTFGSPCVTPSSGAQRASSRTSSSVAISVQLSRAIARIRLLVARKVKAVIGAHKETLKMPRVPTKNPLLLKEFKQLRQRLKATQQSQPVQQEASTRRPSFMRPYGSPTGHPSRWLNSARPMSAPRCDRRTRRRCSGANGGQDGSRAVLDGHGAPLRDPLPLSIATPQQRSRAVAEHEQWQRDQRAPRKVQCTTTDFEWKEALACGAYGSVWLAERRSTREMVAIKVYRKKLLEAKSAVEDTYQERWIMAQIHCEGVVRMYDTWESTKFYFLVLE